MIQFDHVAISTEDVSASVGFYQSLVPACEILYMDTSWALIECAGARIAFVHPDEHPPHLAFRVDSREELLVEAAKSGSSISVHRDRSESFYITDQASNAIEIIFYPE